MVFIALGGLQTSPLVKDQVAAILREEIITGRLEPGERIVEGKWATQLKVAQVSIREALNVLAAEGYVQKWANRTAQVTKFTVQDVIQIYQIREALESLAARLVAETRPDLRDLEQALADMRSAAECSNVRAFFDRDTQFHILVCEKSGNRFLHEHAKRLLLPLFAFVVMRRYRTLDGQELNQRVAEHKQMLEALRTGDPPFVEAYWASMVRRFGTQTYDILMEEKSRSRVNNESEPVSPSGDPRKG